MSEQPRRGFAGGVTRILAGSVTGQGLVILSYPVLARLYDPTQFGLLVAFTAVMMTVAVVGARRGRDLTAYAGLVRTHPWAGGALLLALTSLAGLPPGVLGLIGKIVALRPVLAEGWWVVGVLAAANAVLGVAVYLRWVRVLLQPAPEAVETAMAEGGSGRVTTVTRVRTHPSHLVALGVGTAVLVLGSVQPDLLFGLLG